MAALGVLVLGAASVVEKRMMFRELYLFFGTLLLWIFRVVFFVAVIRSMAGY